MKKLRLILEDVIDDIVLFLMWLVVMPGMTLLMWFGDREDWE